MTDTLPGNSQAHDMIRRVSPEGRARARAEYERRRRATMRIAGRIILAAIVVAVALGTLDWLTGSIAPFELIGAVLAFAIATAAIVFSARERPVTPAALSGTGLHELPERAARWLEAQRPALPAPSISLADSIGVRLEAMQPQLARLDPREPAADAVTKLIAVELPDLVDRYQQTPASLRKVPRDDGQTPDEHLQRGLTLIDAEIGRMTEQLARGAFDQLATQDRYLGLKYEGDAQ